jgi:hypothetical protein
MTIQIFNDDPNYFIYPVLTTGKGKTDIWMQAVNSVRANELPAHPYPRRKNYRLYINPTNGIAPHTGITLTLPLYTQLARFIDSNPPACDPAKVDCTDTFADWWNGGTILLYGSAITPQSNPPSAPQPHGITDALAKTGTGTDGFRTQRLITPFTSAARPTCVGVASATGSPARPPSCETDGQMNLTLYSDVSEFPPADANQLVEYTLGARGVNATQPNNVQIAYSLDTVNVDFDVSYVNIAYAPAAIGVFENTQVGYTGTPQSIIPFQNIMGAWQKAFQNGDSTKGWPQFYRKYIYANIPAEVQSKFPSPLEIFGRLGGANPPPDLVPFLTQTQWNNGDLWPPIAKLFQSWKTYTGTVAPNPQNPYYTLTPPGPGGCQGSYIVGAPITSWCTAMIAVRDIILRNYTNYRTIFPTKCGGGTPITNITDGLVVNHVYGWGPWVESTDGNADHGCAAAVNLLQDTPGYFVDKIVNGGPFRDYTNYLIVKQAFDKLNYGNSNGMMSGNRWPDQQYVFNPWVTIIHGANPPNLGIECAYAYSVDDALGNVQAEGKGFIVDIGSTANLENQTKCAPPITVSLGYKSTDFTKFTHYAVCDPAKKKPINPAFTSFVVSATDPVGCPIYLWDDGHKEDTRDTTPQVYVFTVSLDTTKGTPPLTLDDLFPLIIDPSKQIWTPCTGTCPPPFPPPVPPPPTSTAGPISCAKPANTPAGYQSSSAVFCCDKASSSGIKAFAAPDTSSIHATNNYFVITATPPVCREYKTGAQPQICNVIRTPCSNGK